jgi:hypothetical protein
MRGAAGAPHVSCILIFLDGAAFIDEAIASVMHQQGFDDWELILVDDGSTDASTAMAKDWAASDPPRIRYVEHDGHENLGMSASRNLGIAVARGKYVAFLDCDDVWLPSALAHRTRVADAYPAADLVVGGTWRWHSWSGNAHLAADRRMTLPDAPPYRELSAPRLFSAIYGIPSGGYVPAMCSLLVRRDALLAIGGFEEQFRGIYEDQVLYVKAALHLTAVIDPRPLALYRQHSESACEVSVADGSWSREGPSAVAIRFFSWMQSYVQRETGRGSEESAIVERNLEHHRGHPGATGRDLRQVVRDAMPDPLRAAVRGVRRRWSATPPAQLPVSVVGEWSAQHLRVITASLAGSVLVIVPSHNSGEPWASAIPLDAFGAAAHVTALRLEEIDPAARFDHIVVPFDATTTTPIDELLLAVAPLLRERGSLVALTPVPAWPSGAALDVVDVAAQAQGHFPHACISVETFGNAVTARAVASGTPADEVPGVAIDHHDQHTPVVVALLVSGSSSAR